MYTFNSRDFWICTGTIIKELKIICNSLDTYGIVNQSNWSSTRLIRKINVCVRKTLTPKIKLY